MKWGGLAWKMTKGINWGTLMMNSKRCLMDCGLFKSVISLKIVYTTSLRHES
jgi:hypothetical protein